MGSITLMLTFKDFFFFAFYFKGWITGAYVKDQPELDVHVCFPLVFLKLFMMDSFTSSVDNILQYFGVFLQGPNSWSNVIMWGRGKGELSS